MTDQAPQNPGAPVVTLEERERCTYGGSPTATWLRNSEEQAPELLRNPPNAKPRRSRRSLPLQHRLLNPAEPVQRRHCGYFNRATHSRPRTRLARNSVRQALYVDRGAYCEESEVDRVLQVHAIEEDMYCVSGDKSESR